MRIVLHILGLLTCFFIALQLGLSMHFPTDHLMDLAKYNIHKSSKGKWLVEHEDTQFSPLGKLVLREVSVLHRPKKTAEYESMMAMEKVSLGVSLGALISGQLGGKLQADMFGGQTTLVAQQLSPREWRGEIDSQNINLAMLPTAGESSSLDMTGKLQITGNFKHHLKKIKKTQGKLSLSAENLALVGGEFGPMGKIDDFDFMPLKFSEMDFAFDINNGKAEVVRGNLISESGGLSVEVTGYIKLHQRLERSRYHLNLIVQLGKNFQEFEPLLPASFKAGKQEDDRYHLKVQGRLDSPRLTAVKNRSSRSKRPSMSAEEREDRRRKRQERLEERKERNRRQRLESKGSDINRKNPIKDFDLKRPRPTIPNKGALGPRSIPRKMPPNINRDITDQPIEIGNDEEEQEGNDLQTDNEEQNGNDEQNDEQDDNNDDR